MHDELRLLARSVSRASARLIVTAVDGEDATPSVFRDLFPTGPEGAGLRVDTGMEHPLTLRGVVAELRRSLTSGQGVAGTTDDAAEWLAELAREGVPGAAPRSWYGVRDCTTAEPLRDLHAENVSVSPSRLDSFRTCEVDWAVRELGGDTRNAQTGVGNLIHSAMEHTPPGDGQALWGAVTERWSELEFDAEWISRRSKTLAERMVRRLHGYLRAFVADGGVLLGGEQEFRFEIPLVEGAARADTGDGGEGRGHGYAVVHGFIDRVERMSDGTVVIVDLKTGKYEPRTDKGVTEHLQLAAYQLAYLSGAIDGTDDTTLGGAQLLLVHNANPKSDAVATPKQAALDAEGADGFTALFGELARGMARSEFVAKVEEHCTDPHTYGVCLIHTVKAVSAR